MFSPGLCQTDGLRAWKDIHLSRRLKERSPPSDFCLVINNSSASWSRITRPHTYTVHLRSVVQSSAYVLQNPDTIYCCASDHRDENDTMEGEWFLSKREGRPPHTLWWYKHLVLTCVVCRPCCVCVCVCDPHVIKEMEKGNHKSCPSGSWGTVSGREQGLKFYPALISSSAPDLLQPTRLSWARKKWAKSGSWGS